MTKFLASFQGQEVWKQEQAAYVPARHSISVMRCLSLLMRMLFPAELSQLTRYQPSQRYFFLKGCFEDLKHTILLCIQQATEYSTSHSDKSRGKLTSTHSEPGPRYALISSGSLQEKTPISKKLAFFRDNINSDEGIDGLDDHACTKKVAESSSDTEGEDLVSELEENCKKPVVQNGFHEDKEENKSVIYK